MRSREANPQFQIRGDQRNYGRAAGTIVIHRFDHVREPPYCKHLAQLRVNVTCMEWQLDDDPGPIIVMLLYQASRARKSGE